MMNANKMEAATRDHYREQFAQLECRRMGAWPPWLQRARAAAFERFAELGFPTVRDEDWKYTNVAALEKRAFRLAPESFDGMSADQVARLASAHALPDAHLLVFINGRHAPGLSRPGQLPRGAEVGSLVAKVAQRPDRFEAMLRRDIEAPLNGFTALNAAFWVDGAYIDLAAGQLGR